ncbi:hypothetical protein EWM64_g9737 [Hericium alpestre]|uniref:Uncharacterized protein n=1 Tax=Hericium alpestre TaxID=135208 RepID=A0A4Y9ZHQ9_9AGAM|nr:hypothetical protein EWM64_g9737 [Hericium alpestre]
MDPMTIARLNEELAKLRSIGYVIDQNHVRPGLNMTQAQYNAAQDIILDLLGWGVPPEYLIDCGLSREIVYYVFTELNLRLPANLDTTGILPYPPTEAVVARLLAAAAAPRTPKLGFAHAVPYTPQGSLSRHTREASLHATAPPFVPDSHISASPVLDVSTSLTDMEQQRRQELLKRKVLASRKRKNPNFDAMPTSPKVARTMYVDTQQSTRPLAPAPSVDDFLNSIEPTPASSSSDRALYGVHMGSFSVDIMDVDDIPGLGGSSFTHYAPARVRSMDTIPTPITAEPQSTQPVSHGAADEDVASSSDESKKPAVSRSDRSNGGATEKASNGSGASGYATPMDGLVFDEPPITTRSSPAPVARSGQPLSRRGTKRPVAADFVDADGPHLAAPSSRSFPSRTQSTGEVREDGSGHIVKVQHPNPHVRRKMKAVAAVGASFANVSNMRRCVIDLSDTEEDDEEDEEEFGEFASAKTTGGATPVGGGAAEKSAQELELEIKRMREMIREREEMRSKKLAAQSQRTARSSTPSVDARATRSTTPPEVKEEAVEPSGLTVPPPPPEQEARNEDEDVVMSVAEKEPSPHPSAATSIAPVSVSVLDHALDTKHSVLSTPSGHHLFSPLSIG